MRKQALTLLGISLAGMWTATASAATFAPLTGGNSDQGLDLSNAIAAVNLGAGGDVTLQGKTFVGEVAGGTTPFLNGITISNTAANNYTDTAQTFSDGNPARQANDTALTTIADTLVYTGSNPPPATSSFNVVISGLDTTKTYTLDLILSDGGIDDAAGNGGRHETITVDNQPTSGDIHPLHTTIYDYSDTFIPSASSITVTIHSGDNFDNTPILNGVALSTIVPEPTSLALLGVGAFGVLAGRRRKASY